MASTNERTICPECRSILDLLYRGWETTELNYICPTDLNISALEISAQQCPLCELFLADFYKNNFQDDDLQAWAGKNLVASPIRWPNSDLRGIRLEVQDSRKVQNLIGIARIHLFRPSHTSSTSHFQYS